MEQNLVYIQDRLLGIESLLGSAYYLALDRHLRGVQLTYRHRHPVCTGPIHGDRIFRYAVRIDHLVGQALGAHLGNGTGVHHNANVILVNLPKLTAGTLQCQVDSGVIARQQH